MQAALQASRKLDEAYASLGAAFTAHRAHLDAYAAEQAAANEAMLAAVRRATAAARGALGRTDAAAASAGAVTAEAMDAQAAALSRFEEDFAAGMAQEQAKLLEEVSTMLNSFAARKAAEVAAAVGGMRTTLAGGRCDVDAKFCALTQATTSATSALQSEEAQAAEAAANAMARREELEAIMAGTLQDCTARGSELRGAAAADAAAADALLAGHAAAVEQSVSGALTALSAATSAAKRDCTSAVAGAEMGSAGVLSRFHASHEADRESVSQAADSISKGSTTLQAFNGKHAAELTRLSGSIDGFATRQYTRDPQAGDPPVHAPPEVPPATWIDDMRTPPLEAVLSQFRAQKGGPAAAAPADAAAPPEPATASDAAANEPAETPRSASGSEPDALGGENVNPNRIAAAVSAALGEQPAVRKGGVSRIPGARSRASSRHASPRSRHASPMR
ncbi:probable Kinesin-like protein KIN-5C [Coccomyxa sp. Obi]|nr:probable Kinesin-like protein KIN-5C [Coccomyxa sp. Obi]